MTGPCRVPDADRDAFSKEPERARGSTDPASELFSGSSCGMESDGSREVRGGGLPTPTPDADGVLDAMGTELGLGCLDGSHMEEAPYGGLDFGGVFLGDPKNIERVRYFKFNEDPAPPTAEGGNSRSAEFALDNEERDAGEDGAGDSGCTKDLNLGKDARPMSLLVAKPSSTEGGATPGSMLVSEGGVEAVVSPVAPPSWGCRVAGVRSDACSGHGVNFDHMSISQSPGCCASTLRNSCGRCGCCVDPILFSTHALMDSFKSLEHVHGPSPGQVSVKKLLKQLSCQRTHANRQTGHDAQGGCDSLTNPLASFDWTWLAKMASTKSCCHWFASKPMILLATQHYCFSTRLDQSY